MHGGNIYDEKIAYDFSVNVNPLGVLPEVRQAMEEALQDVSCYPQVESKNLRRELAQTLGVREDCLLLGNGASELFAAVFHALHPKKILLPVPGFSGYTWAARMTETEICRYPMKPEKGFTLDEEILDNLTPEIEMLVLANPNNPTGKYIDAGLLVQILNRCEELEIYVLLDECFMELSDAPKEHSLKKEYGKWKHLLIAGAFTKSFAIPGVRLGYLLGGDAEWINKISYQLPEWNVSLIAQRAGSACIKKWDSLTQVRAYIKSERRKISIGLKQLEIEVWDSDANFLLIRTDLPLYEKLLERGILIRDCSDYPGLKRGYYRIAVKKTEENRMLLQEIACIIEEKEKNDE